mgnify:FL=1
MMADCLSELLGSEKRYAINDQLCPGDIFRLIRDQKQWLICR